MTILADGRKLHYEESPRERRPNHGRAACHSWNWRMARDPQTTTDKRRGDLFVGRRTHVFANGGKRT